MITLVADGLIYRIERDKMAVLDGDLKGMIPVEEPLEHAAPHDAAAAKAWSRMLLWVDEALQGMNEDVTVGLRRPLIAYCEAAGAIGEHFEHMWS